MMNKEKYIEHFLECFPEKRQAYLEHIERYGELLEHIFYADELAKPLAVLLKADEEPALTKKYCMAAEQMWQDGDETVVNVADVTILEYLSDDNEVWQSLGKYISDEFRGYINNELLRENIAMQAVSPIGLI